MKSTGVEALMRCTRKQTQYDECIFEVDDLEYQLDEVREQSGANQKE